jgi:hypothetical protein
MKHLDVGRPGLPIGRAPAPRRSQPAPDSRGESPAAKPEVVKDSVHFVREVFEHAERVSKIPKRLAATKPPLFPRRDLGLFLSHDILLSPSHFGMFAPRVASVQAEPHSGRRCRHSTRQKISRKGLALQAFDAGLEGSIVASKIKDSTDRYWGFNAQTDE